MSKLDKMRFNSYKCPLVKWLKREVDGDPYIVGLWLGSDLTVEEFAKKYDTDPEKLREELLKYKITKENIPLKYIVNDENTRLRLLAGLIDSCSRGTSDSFQLNITSLVQSTKFLISSLGYSCITVSNSRT